MAEITVIVPVYKVQDYLNQCIDSILDQSFQNFDLVLVDDGSPDTCPQICDSYAEKDERITVVHKQNGGLSDARNAGIDWAVAQSNSNFLAFVDSDDYLHPNYLMTLYQTAQKEKADLVICDFTRVNESGKIIESAYGYFNLVTEDKRKLFECLRLNWRVVPAWNKLYHKSCFAALRFPVGKVHEDSFVIHHVFWNCRRAAFIPDELYFYRQRNNSIMGSESVKSKLDGLEAYVEQYVFRQEHSSLLINATPSVDFLYGFSILKSSFDQQEITRFRYLKKRFRKAFFSCPENRTLKHFFIINCTGFYCKAAALLKRKRKYG